jgi:hypothetical protein
MNSQQLHEEFSLSSIPKVSEEIIFSAEPFSSGG